MKRYDSMGFESEWGIYVRWADADAEIALVTKQRDVANQQLARFIDAAAAAFAKRDAVPQRGVEEERGEPMFNYNGDLVGYAPKSNPQKGGV